MPSNAPDPSNGHQVSGEQASRHQDFVKGWPHPSMLERAELRRALAESFAKAITENSAAGLNYGTSADGAFMLGNPDFLNALANFLSTQYQRAVVPNTLMSTGGGSMGIDLCCRAHAEAGDYAVCEAPTFYLAHQMFRERGLKLREVPIQADGMDLDALEKAVIELNGKCKLVYTIPIHHNPTGITMSQAKRTRMAAMAREYKFYVIADEAYQLVNFQQSGSGLPPLFYEDDSRDPRILSVGTFSKLIGPGMKVGWIQADPSLLEPLTQIGFVSAGNNPVIFSSTGLTHFLNSGALHEHIEFVGSELQRKCELLCTELRSLGLVPFEPAGGYFVWVHRANGTITGRSGAGMALDPPTRFADYMRLCFAWLSDEQIIEGVRVLRVH